MPLIHDDFLLQNETARRLYHDVAARLPIIDYHCHLSAQDLAEDRRFADATAIWIASDPYKHRAMRLLGVPEAEITGPATARAKFDRWAAAVPGTIGNPLYHWTALELARYFGIDEPLSPKSAGRIWSQMNAQLQQPTHSARSLVSRMNVSLLCTSDLLLDDLSHHQKLAGSSQGTRVLPSLRADDVLAIDSPAYDAWLGKLGPGINCFDDFAAAVRKRLDAFVALGCRLADHALDDFKYLPASDDELPGLFDRRAQLDATQIVRLKSGLLRWLGGEYARRSWTLQLHIGAQRRTSSRLRGLAGPAGGYGAAAGPCDIPSLCALLDDLEKSAALPRVILYPLNPTDYAAIAILTGSFAEDGVAGKIQFGPAWWYNDHGMGIVQHLQSVAHYGLLSTFIGMTTDSRSLLSMVRHEYFRRIFCNYLGEMVSAKLVPDDRESLDLLVTKICFNNARERFL